MVAGMGIGWYGHWGPGTGLWMVSSPGRRKTRQNNQDRAHGPEMGLVFDCCPDATPGRKVVAVREK